MELIQKLLDVTSFDKLAVEIGAEQLRNRLAIPLISSQSDSDSDPSGGHDRGKPVVDLDRIKQTVKRAQKRKKRILPQGGLAIHVDGVVQGYLGPLQKSCALDLSEYASIVSLVALDEDDEEVVMSTYILFHDDDRKEESWDYAVPGLGSMRCDFSFQEDGVVVASFKLAERIAPAHCAVEKPQFPDTKTGVLNLWRSRTDEFKIVNETWQDSSIRILRRLMIRDCRSLPPGYVSAERPERKCRVLFFGDGENRNVGRGIECPDVAQLWNQFLEERGQHTGYGLPAPSPQETRPSWSMPLVYRGKTLDVAPKEHSMRRSQKAVGEPQEANNERGKSLFLSHDGRGHIFLKALFFGSDPGSTTFSVIPENRSPANNATHVTPTALCKAGPSALMVLPHELDLLMCVIDLRARRFHLLLD